MIRFDEEDSDPYTQMLIYEDDEIKSGRLVAFSLDEFESWLNTQEYPQSMKEAVELLEEFDNLVIKRVHDYHQSILDEKAKREEGTYSERYVRLKRMGYDDKKIHTELFPEEYDFMYDDHVDVKSRQRGENPMSKDYIERVNARRVAGGFLPQESGGGTLEWCISQEINASKQQISELKDPDQPSELLSPEKAASTYKLHTGSGLDLSRLIKLDLAGSSDYATKKLIQIGIVYESRWSSQGHYAPQFKFSDTDGALIFITQDIERANVFVEVLKMTD